MGWGLDVRAQVRVRAHLVLIGDTGQVCCLDLKGAALAPPRDGGVGQVCEPVLPSVNGKHAMGIPHDYSVSN